MLRNRLAAIGLLCGTLAVSALLFFGKFALEQQHNFDYDEAEHALWGQRVAFAIESGNLPTLWQSIREQAFYPPIHSLTVAATYLISGVSLASSRLPSLVLLGLALAIITLPIARTLRSYPAEVRVLTIGVTLLSSVLSPLLIANASLCMIESLAIAVSALFVLVFERVDMGERSPALAGFLFGLLLLLAALVKYPLVVMLAPGWTIALLIPAANGARRAHGIRIATAVITAMAGWVTWYYASNPDLIWYYFFGYPSRGMSASPAALLYYPQQLLTAYTIHPLHGVTLAALAAYGALVFRSTPAARFSFATVVTAYALFSLQAEKGPRYLLPLLPQIWFLSALGIAAFVAHSKRYQVMSAASLGAALFIAYALFHPVIETRIQRAMEGNPSITRLTERAVQAMPAGASVLLIGEGDVFTTRWLRWSMARQQHVAPETLIVESVRLNREPRPAREEAADPDESEPAPPSRAERLRGALARQIAESAFSHLIIFVAPGRAEKYHETWNIEALRKRFSEQSFIEDGWRILLFDIRAEQPRA